MEGRPSPPPAVGDPSDALTLTPSAGSGQALSQREREPDSPIPLGEAGRRGEAPRTGGGAHPLILLIEDDTRSVDLFSLFLREAGFEVAVAGDGAAGLDLARQLRPTCIVLDVILPTVDGWEVINRARSDSKLAGIPIVVASVVDDRARGLALGASDYLVMPVSRDALLMAVQRVVSSRAART